MATHTKRPATREEAEEGLVRNMECWNLDNPDSQIPLERWRQKKEEAEQKGYQNEFCSCGTVYLAFHYKIRCRVEDCPFRSDQTMRDLIMGEKP